MRAKQARSLALVLATILVLVTGFDNCALKTHVNVREAGLLSMASLGGGTSGGNPARTALKFGSYDTSQNAAPSLQGLADFTVCVSRLHFRRATDGTFYDVSPDQLVTVTSVGATIGSFTIPAGSYDQILIDVDNTCLSGLSLKVDNKSGLIQSKDLSTMQFNGPFVSDTQGHRLTLGIEDVATQLADSISILDALNGLHGASGIPTINITVDSSDE